MPAGGEAGLLPLAALLPDGVAPGRLPGCGPDGWVRGGIRQRRAWRICCCGAGGRVRRARGYGRSSLGHRGRPRRGGGGFLRHAILRERGGSGYDSDTVLAVRYRLRAGGHRPRYRLGARRHRTGVDAGEPSGSRTPASAHSKVSRSPSGQDRVVCKEVQHLCKHFSTSASCPRL